MSYQNIQATAVSFQGGAVLIQGPSGVGKTLLALQLIERGAQLIGDDCVQVFLRKNQLYCQAQKHLKGVMEVRELGLVKGFKVAKPTPVLCLIRLHSNPMERLPKTKETLLLNKKIPVFDFYACETNDIRVLYVLKVLRGRFSLLKE